MEIGGRERKKKQKEGENGRKKQKEGKEPSPLLPSW